MKTRNHFLSSLLLCFITSLSFAETTSGSPKDSTNRIPRFSKSPIENSGCSAYLPSTDPKFSISYSEDSSSVYTYEEQIGDHNFAMIHINLSEPFEDSLTQIQTLVSYMEFLKQQFEVSQSTGYGYGHTLSSSPETQGLIDYWADGDGLQYAVKGWVNKTHITVYIIYGMEEYPIYNVKELFFNGIRY